ncbi:hypothetical protein RhiJN_03890 [Ceratobasidium sp. AG-Ba]|nr:hypothetical protein RhiJN_03890 [Ceratobasidium sp. AG-Ba]
MSSNQLATNKISVNSADQDDHIESVTVFQSNRAEIKRRVVLELKQGQNLIDIERLPNCINEDSIRVDGTGTAMIFDVVYHNPHKQPNTPNVTKSESLAVSLRALESLQKEREVAQEQSNVLSGYGKTLNSERVNIEDMGRFLDIFGPRKIAISKQIQELDIKIENAQKEVDQARAEVHVDDRGMKRKTKITVTVLAEVDGPADLLLTYVVSNASWTPLYDVRASIAKSSNDKSTVALHYRASITQTTGEDWPGVALTLSTASPQQGGDVPKLSAWQIGFPAPAPLLSYSLAIPAPPPPPGRSAPPPPGRRLSERSESESSRSWGAAAPKMVVRSAEVVSTGVLSATFGISGHSNIPSDEGSHKVVIAVLGLAAELEWICIPREKERVFLRAKIVNTSEFTLLPGEASVFMDNNFVSKSRIEHVAPSDSFKTSLGVDPALRVTYPTIRTLNRKTDHARFFSTKDSKQSVVAHSQRISIRNSRSSPISGLRVLDHVPVSTDVRIKVNVFSPEGLGPVIDDTEDAKENKGRSWKSVQNGVKARWADLDVGGEGTVEWVCDVQPNTELQLDLAWEVSGPAGLRWETL